MSTAPASGNEPHSSSCGDCGTTYVTVTDADGDFLSYTVDVVSLKLQRASGATVETLPATTRIDFAQYVDDRFDSAADAQTLADHFVDAGARFIGARPRTLQS